MSSLMPLFPGLMCVICFDGIDAEVCWQCSKCQSKWDMCKQCGGIEGCLECKEKS